MPKQVHDIKEFLNIANSKSTTGIVVMTSKDCVKFKARTPRYRVTLVIKDSDKADKLIKLLPTQIKPKFIGSA